MYQEAYTRVVYLRVYQERYIPGWYTLREGSREPFYPFHCWARKEASCPPYPFHCWARKEASQPPFTTRFTVGLARRLLYHPFHCWARLGEKLGMSPCVPWVVYTSRYMPPCPPFVGVLPPCVGAVPGLPCVRTMRCVPGFTLLVTLLKKRGSPRRKDDLSHLRNKLGSPRKQA